MLTTWWRRQSRRSRERSWRLNPSRGDHRPSLFRGRGEYAIDDKGRLTLPAHMRKPLVDGGNLVVLDGRAVIWSRADLPRRGRRAEPPGVASRRPQPGRRPRTSCPTPTPSAPTPRAASSCRMPVRVEAGLDRDVVVLGCRPPHRDRRRRLRVSRRRCSASTTPSSPPSTGPTSDWPGPDAVNHPTESTNPEHEGSASPETNTNTTSSGAAHPQPLGQRGGRPLLSARSFIESDRGIHPGGRSLSERLPVSGTGIRRRRARRLVPPRPRPPRRGRRRLRPGPAGLGGRRNGRGSRPRHGDPRSPPAPLGAGPRPGSRWRWRWRPTGSPASVHEPSWSTLVSTACPTPCASSARRTASRRDLQDDHDDDAPEPTGASRASSSTSASRRRSSTEASGASATARAVRSTCAWTRPVGTSAADLVNTADEAELARIIRRFGDERHAARIARAIVASRPIRTTEALAEVVRDAIPAAARRTGGHPATRTFQALRIEVNDELGQLERTLGDALDLLVPGGRAAVITYHSGEDRIVARRFRDAAADDCVCPPGAGACRCGGTPSVKLVPRKAITAIRGRDRRQPACPQRPPASRRAARRGLVSGDGPLARAAAPVLPLAEPAPERRSSPRSSPPAGRAARLAVVRRRSPSSSAPGSSSPRCSASPSCTPSSSVVRSTSTGCSERSRPRPRRSAVSGSASPSSSRRTGCSTSPAPAWAWSRPARSGTCCPLASTPATTRPSGSRRHRFPHPSPSTSCPRSLQRSSAVADATGGRERHDPRRRRTTASPTDGVVAEAPAQPDGGDDE